MFESYTHLKLWLVPLNQIYKWVKLLYISVTGIDTNFSEVVAKRASSLDNYWPLAVSDSP